MKAAVLYKTGEPLRIEEIDVPPIDDEDLLIRVAACGVCHTDLKVVHCRSAFKPPHILGHEVSGTRRAKWDGIKPMFSKRGIGSLSE